MDKIVINFEKNIRAQTRTIVSFLNKKLEERDKEVIEKIEYLIHALESYSRR